MNDFALREIARERCAAIHRGVANERRVRNAPNFRIRRICARAIVIVGIAVADFGRTLAENET